MGKTAKNAVKGAGVGAVGGGLLVGALTVVEAVTLTTPAGWAILIVCVAIGAVAGALAD